ncbi:MAG: spermidine synthase, partial [Planctomycetota bacterium]
MGAGRGRTETRPAASLLLFYASGAVVLVYETLWFQEMARLSGSTTAAAATTLGLFFLGLSAGAWWWGARAPRLLRPLAAYGWLEIGVGAAACLGFLTPALHAALRRPLALLFGTDPGTLPAALAAAAGSCFLPAAFLMGGTLPVMGEHLIRHRGQLGVRGSLLYGVNTLGAVTGVLVAGFLLGPRLGRRGSLLLAVAASVVVGLLALWLQRGRTTSVEVSEGPPRGSAAGPRAGRLAVLAFGSGALALALEVLAIRLYAQVLTTSVFTFAIVLAVFLLALALGAGLAGWFARRGVAGDGLLRALLVVTAVFVVATGHWFLTRTPELALRGEGTWTAYLLGVAGGACAVLLPVVIVAGTVFPALLHAAESLGWGPGRSLGRLAAWNTLGAVGGAFWAGFVLLPHVGLWGGLRAVAVAYAALALVGTEPARSHRVRLVPLAGILLVVLLPLPAPMDLVRLEPGQRVVSLREGSAATVAVVERADGALQLKLDNHLTLGGSSDPRWEALQAHLPLCLHGAPRRVFFLGLGAGVTAGAALDHPVERLDVAELVPEVIEAARADFGPFTGGLFADLRAHVYAGDGRQMLAAADEPYDVVVADLFFPWQEGTANLYTLEHFRTVRTRLTAEGLFAQWLPLFQLTEAEFLGIARTMVEAFESVTLWRGDFFVDRPIVALVGRRRVVPLDALAFADGFRRLTSPAALQLARDADTIPFHLYAGNLTAARSVLGHARLHTDDLPWIGYEAPRSEHLRRAGRGTAFVGDALLAFETALHEAVPAGADPVLASFDEPHRRRVRAGLSLRAMANHMARMRGDALRQARLDYIRLVP